MRRKSLVLALVLGFLAITALADGNDGTKGGGDAFVCKQAGLSGLLGQKYVRFVDTYDVNTRNNRPWLATIESRDEESGLKFLIDQLKERDPNEGIALEYLLENIKWQPDENLEDLPDDITATPDGCEKVQLGVQDLSDQAFSVVRYRKSLYDRLSTPERVFFKIHEAWIRREFMKTGRPVLNTEAVRAQVAQIALNVTISNEHPCPIDHAELEAFVALTIKQFAHLRNAPDLSHRFDAWGIEEFGYMQYFLINLQKKYGCQIQTKHFDGCMSVSSPDRGIALSATGYQFVACVQERLN